MKILIDGQLLEQVSDFRYLGIFLSEGGYCEKKICTRTAMGKKTVTDKKTVHRQIKLVN